MGKPVKLAGERVLVVDDEPSLRSAYVRILTTAGFNVDACDSGEEAIARLSRGERYLVIVTDLLMSGMDGIELIPLVREFDDDVPVIIMTGRPSLYSSIAAVEHHSFRYLIKPVTPHVLAETVRSAAAMSRLAALKRRALEECGNKDWRTEAGSLDERLDCGLKQLFMVYQPIVDANTGAAFGYEALVRSADSEFRGPEPLFNAAERLDRVQELGRMIRSQVSSEIESAPEGSVLFVNLHANDLTDGELYSPESPLSHHASRVVLEITERKSLDGVPDVRARLTALRNLGYRIALDDLGAGYAGLSCFNALEPEIVKLDMSLIRDIDTSPRKRALVESMIRVCLRDLGTQVVCEGVETKEEHNVLLAVGAPLLQGYLFARPQREFWLPNEADLQSHTRLIVSNPPTSRAATGSS